MRVRLAQTGGAVRLEAAIGQGGEGAVFPVTLEDDRSRARFPGPIVAKLYHHGIDEERRAKVLAMVRNATSPLLAFAAWPLDALLDERDRVCGFIMRRVGGHCDIHELYGPKSRMARFPKADFRFLCHVSSNLARAFSVVHEHDHVIGDVNHGNVMVASDGTVHLIDCDSMQVLIDGVTYGCYVGSSLFLAPELQGASLRTVRRTANHDAFALAMLVFHLLCLGRHPYSGRFTGEGEMPIEAAIAQGRFAYGVDSRDRMMEPPPGAPTLESLGRTATEMFRRAFLAKNGAERPSASAWVKVLTDMQANLRQCGEWASHWYASEARSCPWCPIEAAAGIRLFGVPAHASLAAGSPDYGVGLQELYAAINGIQDPGEAKQFPVAQVACPRVAPPAHKVALRHLRIAVACAAASAGMVACSVVDKKPSMLLGVFGVVAMAVIWPRASADKLAVARRLVAEANAKWAYINKEWSSRAARRPFDVIKQRVDKSVDLLNKIPGERARRLEELRSDRRKAQLNAFLDMHLIRQARLSGIHYSLAATLASHGIETAADVEPNRVRSVYGFGPVRTATLMRWKSEIAATFVFDESKPVGSAEVAMVDKELGELWRRLVEEVRKGGRELETMSREITQSRLKLGPEVERVHNQRVLALEALWLAERGY
jgi:DNA-binding helix-hairpin-helix protein with protein kinase domain